jgi:hypothetical protein
LLNHQRRGSEASISGCLAARKIALERTINSSTTGMGNLSQKEIKRQTKGERASTHFGDERNLNLIFKRDKFDDTAKETGFRQK